MNEGLISVIGSCRVFSPLHKVINSYPFKFNHGKTEWFTHSTRDVIQKIKIVNADIEVPDTMVSMIINDLKKYNPDSHKPNFYGETDCFVIEICSIQTNLLNNFELQQWCVRNLKINQEENANILDKLISTQMTEEEIIKDLETIYDLLGCRPLLLVSHNMLTMQDGTLPKSRSIIRRSLESFSNQKQNVYLFDPTPFIFDYGVDRAMKDTAHYTKEFEPIIGQAIAEKLLSIDASKYLI